MASLRLQRGFVASTPRSCCIRVAPLITARRRQQCMPCPVVQQSTAGAGLGRLVCRSVDDTTQPGTSGRHWEEEQLELMWDSVSRALLKLGRRGVTDPHARSLQALLADHGLVKVQLNGFDDDSEAAQATAEALAAKAQAELVQRKGTTLLFARCEADRLELLELARAAMQKTMVWKEKRAADRQQKREVVAATMAKREANASRSRKKVSGFISAAIDSSGPLTRESLKNEWIQIARNISDEEEGTPTRGGKASPKQPWKRREQQQQQQQQQPRGARPPAPRSQQQPQRRSP